jgi:hypothetical protein
MRRRLERNGTNVGALQYDIVTYQAIQTYLQSYREAKYTADKTDPLEPEATKLWQLRGRTVP